MKCSTGNHTLTLKIPLILAGASAPKLTYWTKYVFDSSGQGYVEVSTNGGATWTSVQNLNGNQTGWISKEVDLSAYIGQTIRLRFRKFNGQSWWLDDIAVTAQ
jgi:hypothetical protein